MADRGSSAPHAVVSCGSFRRVLIPGEAITFGRGNGHPLRLGHAPEDLRVPRFAGRLECRDDGVLVHNMSDKRTLVVRTFPGPEYEVLPLMIAGTHPHPIVKVILTGNGAEYHVTVDTRGLRAEPLSSVEPERATPSTVGFDRIDEIAYTDRLLLAALCLPLMTRYGAEAHVPSYQEMESILNGYGHELKQKTIKNRLDRLRQWLVNERGVEGLLRVEGMTDMASNPHLVRELARWAILSGNVTDFDLDLLEESQAPRRPPRVQD
jgi:hypothetical protein